jgi:diaminobutyrate-2-oxoglutarate transaminase
MALETPIGELHFAEEPQVESIPGPRSRQLREQQRRLDSSAVSYPTSVPLAFSEGRGATLRDVDGNVLLDFFSTIGVLNVGHSNPYVLEGAIDQMESLVHSLDFPTETRLELIAKLDEIAPGGLPGNNRVIFGGPTGSDAIEATIKLAKYNTGGDGLIAFRGGYHGSTAGAMSLNGAKDRKSNYTPMLPNIHFVRYPYPFQQGLSPKEAVERSLDELRSVFEDPWSGISNPAGIWVEPVQGSGGIVVPPDGFLTGVKEIAKENDIPLICDEIQAGFGRTGKWFSCEWEDITPDVVSIAKSVGGIGLPLAATMYHERLDTWEPGSHVGTFRGNLPAMRAGIRAIEYVQTHDLLDHARAEGRYIRDRLREAADESPFVGKVRGRGLFIGVEFVDESGNPCGGIVDEIQEYCYKRGVLIWTAGRFGNVLRIMPPLVITHRQAEAGSNVIAEAIREISRQYQ